LHLTKRIMMKKLQLLIALCLFSFFGMESVAQTTVYTQDFETENSGYTPSSTEGTSGSFVDIFNRSNPDIGGNDTFIFAIEDTNATPATITLDNIDVSSLQDFTFSIDLLAHHFEDWDSTDEVLITYTLDGGASQNLMAIQHVPNDANNEPAALDTDFDGDGECSPTTLLPALTTGTSNGCEVPNGDNQFRNFSSSTITLNGNTTLSILFTVNNLTSADEGIYFDNIKVEGTPANGNPAPSITNISNTPTTPESTDAVTITADVTDTDGVNSVTLQYGFSTGVYDELPIAMTNSAGDTYTAAIAAQADGTTVFYRIVATDSNATAATTNTTEQSYTVADPVPAPSLIITEVADPGDEFSGRFVEIYNNGSTAIDFSSTEVHFARQSNGGNISSIRLTGTLNVGDFYVIGNSSNINTQYGAPADLDFGSVTGNGDDGYFLYVGGDENNGTLFDSYGVLNQNGNGEAWDYEDSRAVRNDINDSPNATWQAASWTITAADVADMTPGAGESKTYTYDAGVWSPNAPDALTNSSTSSDDILVLSGLAAISGNVDIRNITVQDGATLDLISNTVDLSITGDVTTTGTGAIFGPVNSLNFAGVNQQELSTDIAVTDLILNNANGLILNGLVDVEGSLDLTNGALTTNDNLTMKSSAGKSAVLLEVTSGSITGNVTVEQFYPAQRAFRFVSSPVTMDGTIFFNWQQNGMNPGDRGYQDGLGTQITGGDASNGFDQSTSNNPSAFTYDVATNNWVPLAATNDATTSSLSAGDALRLFIRGDRGVSLTTALNTAADTKLLTSGTPAVGDVVVPNMNTTDQGFTLVGNPYQAQVNMNLVYGDAGTTDINQNFMYAWDPTIAPSGAYVVYDFVNVSNNVIGSEVNQFLQPNQAVFIQTTDSGSGTANPSMIFKESFKSNSANTLGVYSSRETQSSMRISLIADSDSATGRARDGVVMNFDATGNNEVDNNDAIKLVNLNENLSIDRTTDQLSISNMESPVNNQEILLQLSGLLENNYTFNIDNAYAGAQNVYFYDTFLDEHLVLSSGLNTIARSFDFTDPASMDISRFKLVFSDQTLSLESLTKTDFSIYPNPLSGDVLYISNLTPGEELSLNVYDMSGKLLKSVKKEASNTQESIKVFAGFKKGVYLVAVRQNKTSSTFKLLKK
jgi:hypothetical protein